MTATPRGRAWSAVLATAGALVAIFVWQGAQYRKASRALRPEVEALETLAYAGGEGEGSEPAAAPRTSWAHLLAALHEAAGKVPLDEFGYSTGEVVESPPKAQRRSLVMTAEIEGSADYERITAFVRGLAATSPPLDLRRIEISAGPRRPRFRATVGLETSLPVAVPRVVALEPVP